MRPASTPPHSIVLDAEALSALANTERRMQPWAEFARRTDSQMYVSIVTLAETTDGGTRDIAIRRAAKSLQLEPVTEAVGYRAGRLRATATSGRRAARDLTVDAVVASTALKLPAPVIVLTSDGSDLLALLDGTAVRVERI